MSTTTDKALGVDRIGQPPIYPLKVKRDWLDMEITSGRASQPGQIYVSGIVNSKGINYVVSGYMRAEINEEADTCTGYRWIVLPWRNTKPALKIREQMQVEICHLVNQAMTEKFRGSLKAIQREGNWNDWRETYNRKIKERERLKASLKEIDDSIEELLANRPD